jgi:hypothetical protein
MNTASRAREIDCDGSTTANLMTLAGKPCSWIQLLATGTGSLTLTMATPFSDSATEALLITSAPVGTKWGVSCTAVKGPNGAKILVGWED